MVINSSQTLISELEFRSLFRGHSCPACYYYKQKLCTMQGRRIDNCLTNISCGCSKMCLFWPNRAQTTMHPCFCERHLSCRTIFTGRNRRFPYCIRPDQNTPGQTKAPFSPRNAEKRVQVNVFTWPCRNRHSPVCSPQALSSEKLWSAVLSEVLNGTNHLRSVRVLVVVPRHDLDLVGVVVATLVFRALFVVVSNFETTVTVPQRTVVVLNPACSYHYYTTFQRYFQVFSVSFFIGIFMRWITYILIR